MKKDWKQPALEVLDVSETMKFWSPPKNGGGISGDDSGGDGSGGGFGS
ncbi:paeninodin family lasso peptide [Bacillus suaedae]|uniref:Paeninodin family lasso peptide n=1 Tax=Halalkalibacter suaedae TaxID=2822140 RepID=A0A940WVT3_9BACI|nr:paeninodin family lasso peptide [Bacillus suaedae]MBP3951497.1 paeninodin family lasso peptide [Bacillus suaedae]